MPTYCPTCRGVMRPSKGTLVCIACTARAKARTVMAQGRRINLKAGQVGLALEAAAPSGGPAGIDPPLTPQAAKWKARVIPDARPHERLGLFPHDEIRDGQVRFMRDVKLAIEGGRHLIAHAPTGIGKTAASLAPALEAALTLKKTVLFLTNRQSQHRIAVDTLRIIRERRGVAFTLVDLVSKRDMCLRPEAAEMHPARFPDFCARETRAKSCRYIKNDVDKGTLQQVRDGVLHVEELMAVGKASELCPHAVALAASHGSQVVIADYNHVFSDIRDTSLDRLGIKLPDTILVVDEAHNLGDRIRSGHSHRVTPLLLDLVMQECRTHKAGDVEADAAAFRLALANLAAAKEGEGAAQPARLAGRDTRVARLTIPELDAAYTAVRNRLATGTTRTLQQMLEGLQKLARAIRKDGDGRVAAEELAEAVEDWGRFQDGALRYLEWQMGEVQLHIRLLDPAVAARPVFHEVHSAIVMSGTLRPPEMARDTLGLEPGRTTTRTYLSPYPRENRFTVIAQGVSTRFDARGQALWQRLAADVRAMAGACHGNLAVFCPSYSIVNDVRAELGDCGKELVVESPDWDKRDRDQVLDTLTGLRSRGGALLLGVLGGSFAEGVDFKDNLLSAVVVVGVPLAPPELEVEATIAHYEARHPGQGRNYGYVVPAMNRVLQATGRGIRGPTDKCAVVLWDERYQMQPYRALIPDDVPLVATRDPAGAAAEFLRRHGL